MTAHSSSRATLLIAAGTSVSRLLGVARSIVLVTAIGSTGIVANSLGTASQITNMIYTLVATGVLTSVLVPQITKASASTDKGVAYIDRLITLVLVGAGGVCVSAALLSPLLISWLGAPWKSAEQESIATIFAFWLVPQIFFFALYTVLGEVLNSRSLFGPYAWTPVLNNLVSIGGLIAFIWFFGSDPDGLRGLDAWKNSFAAFVAGSATAGVAVQALALFLFFRRANVRYRPDFRFRGIGLGATIRLGLWTFLSVLVSQIVALLAVQAMNRASVGEAGVAAWQLTSLVGILPHSIIVMSIVTSRFTRMSVAANRGDHDALRVDLVSVSRISIILMTFISLALLILVVPVTRLLMPSASVSALYPVAGVLACHIIGMLSFSLLFIFNRGFFAFSNTKTPFILQAAFSCLTALIVGMSYFFPSSMATVTITLGSNLLFGAQAIVTLLILRRLLGGIHGRKMLNVMYQCAGAGLIAGSLGLLVLQGLGGIGPGGFAVDSILGALATCAAVAAVVGSAYFTLLFLLRTPEVRETLIRVRKPRQRA